VKISKLVCRTLVSLVFSTCIGADFVNLNFDCADTTDVPFGQAGPTEKLLPGWSLYEGAIPSTQIYFGKQVDTDFVSLYYQSTGYALELLRSDNSSPQWTLEQVGTVPLRTKYLIYWLWGSAMGVHVNGQTIDPVNRQPLDYAGNPTNLVYDVSGFAGQEVQLDLVGPITLASPTTGHGASAKIDSVQFVTSPPTLAISRFGTNIVLSWPSTAIGYVLQSAVAFTLSNNWQTVAATPVVVGNQQGISTNLSGKATFYRLALP
jgi:hypothetical protein